MASTQPRHRDRARGECFGRVSQGGNCAGTLAQKSIGDGRKPTGTDFEPRLHVLQAHATESPLSATREASMQRRDSWVIRRLGAPRDEGAEAASMWCSWENEAARPAAESELASESNSTGGRGARSGGSANYARRRRL